MSLKKNALRSTASLFFCSRQVTVRSCFRSPACGAGSSQPESAQTESSHHPWVKPPPYLRTRKVDEWRKTGTQTGEAGRGFQWPCSTCSKWWHWLPKTSHCLNSEPWPEIHIDKNTAPLCTKANSQLFFCAAQVHITSIITEQVNEVQIFDFCKTPVNYIFRSFLCSW